MRITDLKIHLPVGLLRIVVEDGTEGWCFGVGEAEAHQIQASYREVLLGRDPFEREALWQELFKLDRMRYLPQALRGLVDVALWDLCAKLVNLPVYRLIGGFRERIPVYKSGGNLPTVEDFAEDAARAQAEGFWGYKDHCYHGREAMIRVARAARAAVGPEFRLMHDAVQHYTYNDALAVGRELEAQNYFWFEEPLRDFDLLGLKKLSDALDVPVAAAEYLPGSLYATSQLLATQAVDIVRASVPWRGGITDMLKIAHLAEAFGVNCEITSVGVMWGFVHAHVIAALRNCTFFEGWQVGPLGGAPLIHNPLVIEQGTLTVPQGAGLGLELNWAEIERQTTTVLAG